MATSPNTQEPSRPVTEQTRDDVRAELAMLLGGTFPNGGRLYEQNRRRCRIKRRHLVLCMECGAEPSDRVEDEYWRIGKRRDAVYCSNACRQKAYRKRVRQEREEWRNLFREQAGAHPLYAGLAELPLSSPRWPQIIDTFKEAVDRLGTEERRAAL